MVVIVFYVVATNIVPEIAAGALLHPARRPVTQPPPAGCSAIEIAGDDVILKGWRCDAIGERRGTLVFLHGVADNRASVTGAIGRFTAKGFEVVAYDSRAQGESTGDVCTY